MEKDGKPIEARRAEKLLQHVCQSLQDVVSSPSIENYAIGLTGNPVTRLQSYQRKGTVRGFVLLTWGMSRDLALHVEEGVYRFIGFDRRSHTFKKCHKRISLGPYRSSANYKFSEHYLYVVWFFPPSASSQ